MKKFLSLIMIALLVSFTGCATGEKAKKTKSSAKKSNSSKSVVDTENNYEWKSHPEDYKLIAFTFDDAPSYSNINGNPTSTIIKILNRYEGAGTLFVIGDSLQKNSAKLLNYAVEHGFELGNHSYSHVDMGGMTKGKIKNEIEKTNALVKSQTGKEPKFFRAPFLDVSTELFDVCTELNMPVIKGSKDASLGDGIESVENGMTFIRDTCINGAYDGQIVLMHGYNKYTASALPQICETLYNDGYRFVTLSELFSMKKIKTIPTDVCIDDAAFD